MSFLVPGDPSQQQPQMFGSGGTDFLDLLAEIASQELHKVSDEVQQQQQPPRPKAKAARKRGSNRSSRLEDVDQFGIKEIKRMSMASMVKLFAEQEADEVARRFRLGFQIFE